MKSKSILRRLEQLERKVTPKHDDCVLVICDRPLTAEELKQYEGCKQLVCIIEDELPE